MSPANLPKIYNKSNETDLRCMENTANEVIMNPLKRI